MVAADLFMLPFRCLHIVAGVLWVGDELEYHGKMDLAGLLIAVTLMDTARYW